MRTHLLAVAVIALGLAVAGLALTFGARVNSGADLSPPNHGLPYTAAKYSVAEAKRAFAQAGARITLKSHSRAIVTLGNARNTLEVDVFASPATVEQSGFYDYTLVDGRYVRFPTQCAPGAYATEHWQGNVRAMVSCTRDRQVSNAMLQQAEKALGLL